MDIGGGLVVADAGSGLAVDVQVRMLVVHQAEGFRERGMAVSLSYNPTPSTPTGFTVKVAPSWGGRGEERRRGAVGPGDDGGDGGTSEYGKAYRLGYGLAVLDRESLNFELGADAHRRESPMLGGTDNGFRGRATLGW